MAFFYYWFPYHVGQLWVGGFHVHHLYVGLVMILVSIPLWVADRRALSLFLLGVGLVLAADGVRWALM